MTLPAHRTRLHPDDRRASILTAAIEWADTNGFTKLTRDAVAKAAGVSPALVTFYFWHVTELKRVVMEEAVNREVLSIILTGIALGDPIAMAAPNELKQRAFDSI